MKLINRILLLIVISLSIVSTVKAQETMYIYKDGAVVGEHVLAEVDSVIFYQPEQGKVIDNDGNEYQTVVIGTQTWMAENLRTTSYNDGAAISYIADNNIWENATEGAYCWYNNDEETCKEPYGALYNWYTVETSKLCPSGWHVPSQEEWSTLSDYLITNGFGFEGSGDDIAKSLASKTTWQSFSTAGTIGTDMNSNNTCEFNAVSTGYRYGDFYYIGKWTSWWSSTESTVSGAAWYYFLEYNSAIFSESYIGYFKGGKSIRCIKNLE